MKLIHKKFEELSLEELYEILQIRSAVFVVEQNCIYQDIDGIDQRSMHLFYEDEGRIKAYLRYFDKKDEEGTIQIGRVLTVERGKGLGGKLLHECMRILKEDNVSNVYLEAQEYATGFYEKEGFYIDSDVFLEDGIPHVCMRWTNCKVC